MKEIKNVIICGLGGLGCICAVRIKEYNDAILKILVDEERYERYLKHTTYFNEKPYTFDYILPTEPGFKADLIIIATKSDGLDFAIKAVENFVTEDTVFLSLLNGISSEEEIAKKYGWKNTLLSFYIGHSCLRKSRNITQDGIYKFVIGSKYKENNEALARIKTFFEKADINYEISTNIQDEYWKKYMINVGINQLSAVTGLTLKDIKRNESLTVTLKGLMKEVESIAAECGIYNHKEIYRAAEDFLLKELDDATPSMLQDIKAGRKTEVEIFAGTVIKLGEKYNISTPLNKKIYMNIKDIEEKNLKAD